MRRTSGRSLRLLAVLGLLTAGAVALPAPVAAQQAPAGTRTVTFGVGGLQPLQPARLLDTRDTGATVDGVESRTGAVRAGEERAVTIAGRGGVPVVGAGAAWLNVTVTGPSSPGFVTVFPAGAARPNASNVNFSTGQTVPNLVLAKLGRGGKVLVLASASTHVIVDVVGWVPEGPDVQPLQPARALDTRSTGRTVDGLQQAGGPVGAGQSRRLPLAGRAGVPAAGVSAVVLNLTATGPTRSGYVTAHPAGSTRPNASSLNFATGQTVPNLVVAKVGSSGAVDVYNSGGSTHLIADVVGWIPDTSSYGSLQPARVLDTRSTGATVDGQSRAGGPLGGPAVRRLPVLGRAGVPATGVGAVVLNVTATGASRTTHLTVFPTGAGQPNASNLNVINGSTRANLVTAKVGSDGSVSIANAAGSVHVVADVVGWFPSSTTSAPPGEPSGSVTMVLPATTELAGAGDVVALTGTAVAPTALRLSPSADVPPVSGHLVVLPNASVPDGTLVAVTGVTPQSDGSALLAVQRAAVPDAFVDLDVTYAGPLVLADPAASGPSLRSGARLREAERSFGFGPVDRAGFSCTGDGGASVSFDAGFLASSAEISYDLSERFLRFLVTTAPTVAVGMTSTGTVTCTRHLELPGKLPLGPTGLSLSAELDLSMTVSGTITAAATISTPLALGFEYRAGTVTGLSGATYGGSAAFGQQDASVSLTVTPAVEFDLEFLGAVELGLALGLPITASLTGGTPCSAAVDVAATLGASAELELPWLPDVEEDLGSYDLGSAQVWSGPCGAVDPPPPVGNRTASLSMSYDQPTATEGGGAGGVVSRSQEQSVSVAFPTVGASGSSTFQTVNASAGNTGKTASVPVAQFRSERVESNGETSCRYTHSGFREAGQVRLTTFPDAPGDPWEWSVNVAAADHRRLDQVRPGETVWVAVTAYLQGVATLTSAGDGCPEDGFMQEYVEEAFLLPASSSTTASNCAPGASMVAVTGPGQASECAFPVVVQPDGGIVLQRTVQTHATLLGHSSATPVTYGLDLRISGPAAS